MESILSSPLTAAIVGLCGGVYCVSSLLLADRRVARRVSGFVSRHALSDTSENRSTAEQQSVRTLGPIFRVADRRAELIGDRLASAGYHGERRMLFYRVTQVYSVTALGLVSYLLISLTPSGSAELGVWAGAIGSLAGYLLPPLWLRHCAQLRRLKINRSLPDLLDLIVSCLDAGVTLEAVLQRITSDQMFRQGPLAEEMARVQNEVSIGATLDQALENFADRINSDNIRSLSTVCSQSRKYGVQISATLRLHSDTLREQREQQAEESAQKAAVKVLAPTLLCLFPVIFVILAGPAVIQIHENLAEARQAR